MNESELTPIIATALRTMGYSEIDLGPRPLREFLIDSASKRGKSLADSDVDDAIDLMLSDDVNAAARRLFTQYLHQWDYGEAGWCGETGRNSETRRQLIYDLLQLPTAQRARVDELIPARTLSKEPTVIALSHDDWYTPARRAESSFYWDSYSQYLRDRAEWPEDSIDDLNRASDGVVRELSEPSREAAYQTKGMVVGYVQSGKTANFIGVIAKAADAGYRLIVVLGGTLDLLRNQTQRRIDKQLIGKELILADTAADEPHDYIDDQEWEEFISYGAIPSELGSFDWHRLTGAKGDYQSLRRGLLALEFERARPDRRLNSMENLRQVRARMVVIKKNSRILTKFIKDLRGLTHTPLASIPALIIDDESDQASLNTLTPDRQARGERTATNAAIVELLRILPRSQYVGYTATPVANVFVNPDDAVDLFPKDFIISLQKPSRYMGVSDFFDLADGSSNERTYVRGIWGDDTDDSNLPRAFDLFILSGAIKLYRQSVTTIRFRHHTMLIHRSHKISEHEADVRVVETVFRDAKYGSPQALGRLQALYEEEFTSALIDYEEGVPRPPTFPELLPFVERCLSVLGDSPVAIVNGDRRYASLAPDFESGPIWKVLVGGTKLSRGYTVEGLTISYYRRRARNADTLMQMGRWFGYRYGYRDLVRLFIGRAEPDGRTTFDLLEAFKSICLDEEDFRDRLGRYSRESDPRITPRDVPPLVPAHLLAPTSRNKMYNAVLKSQNFGGEWVERTLAPTDEKSANSNNSAAKLMLSGTGLLTETYFSVQRDGETREMVAHWALLDKQNVLTFLESYRWSKPGVLGPVLEFARGAMGDPCIDDWLFVAPQLQDWDEFWLGTKKAEFSVAHRARVQVEPYRFKTYSEPRHRKILEYIVGIHEGDSPSESVVALKKPRRAVLLFYPVRDMTRNENIVSMGFALLFPSNLISRRLLFVVHDPSKEDAIVVDK